MTALLVAAWSSNAGAQPSEEAPSPSANNARISEESKQPHFGGQRNLGVEFDAGLQSGFGAGLTLGEKAGVRATVGWSPVIIVTAGYTTDIHFYSGGQIAVDAFALPFRMSERVDVGFAAGYRYHSLLGHGGGAAFTGRVDLSKNASLSFFGGLWFFPKGEDRLREKKPELWGYDFQFPGPSVVPGGGIALTFYP